MPEPPLPPEPPEPPVGEDDEVGLPNPPEDCEPFDPAYPVVDITDDDTSSTVELSLQGDDQLQLCVTPLVVATYALFNRTSAVTPSCWTRSCRARTSTTGCSPVSR